MAGTVKQIDAAQFENEVLKQPGRVLVDFFAIWCPPCRTLAPVLERFAEQHADVRVVKVDADGNEELAERYGVRTIPTVIAFVGGKEVHRAINPQSIPALMELTR